MNNKDYVIELRNQILLKMEKMFAAKKRKRDAKNKILYAFCASLWLIDFEFFVPLCLRGRFGSACPGKASKNHFA
jgi:hypothetical protein